jgi:hypothetical protein
VSKKTPPDDPFADLNALRISQNFLQSSGVEKLLLKVPVRKPNRQEFFRVHPGEDHRLDTVMVELTEDREWYFPAPAAREAVLEEAKPVRLLTGITRQGVLFLWPARLPDADGRTNHWHNSALEAAELAETSWVRMAASRPLGAYQVYRALGDLPEPFWPDKPFSDLLRIAFANGYLIDDVDHPVIRRLTGRL